MEHPASACNVGDRLRIDNFEVPRFGMVAPVGGGLVRTVREGADSIPRSGVAARPQGRHMAELLILEFAGVDESVYAKTNAKLGLDPDSGSGDWPPGLISHVTGLSEDGHGYVAEVWESQQAQADFMNSRLAPALAEGAVAPERVTWARVIGYHNPAVGYGR